MISTKVSRKESKEVKQNAQFPADACIQCGQSLANLAPSEIEIFVKRFTELGGKIIYEEQQKIEGFVNSAVSADSGLCDGRYRIELGKKGEKDAEVYLEERGWRIIERNWRAGRRGEIDLIARDPANCLVFIEVKARRIRPPAAESDGYHTGFESVQGLKQRKIIDLALKYLNRYGLSQSDVACRFDVLVVQFGTERPIHENSSGPRPEVIHVIDAFDSIGWS